MRRLILGCSVLMSLLMTTPAQGADAIGVSPASPKTGSKNQVTFAAPAGGTGYTWDLNGDGTFGDAAGQSTTWAYDLPGSVTVRVRYADVSGPQELSKEIVLNGPPAVFVTYPPVPAPGQSVMFVYSPAKSLPDPPQWDLNGDGIFPDATGTITFHVFPSPDTYVIGLRVSDADEATSTGTQLVTVKAPDAVAKVTKPTKPRLISPFPIVRITGKVSRRGARIKRFTVQAPFGSTLKVSCRGRGCPFRRSTKTLASTGSTKSPAKTVTIRRLQRRLLYGGASVKVLVSRPGEIGKYTRFRIRRGKPPQRSDSCLRPGSTAPVQCPST